MLTLVTSDGPVPIGGHQDSLRQVLCATTNALQESDGPVSLVAGNLRTPAAALQDLTSPRPGPATAVISQPGSQLRILHHQIVGVALAGDLPGGTADLGGILRLNAPEAAAAAAALSQLLAAPDSASPLAEGSDGEGDAATGTTETADAAELRASALRWVVFALARAGQKVGVDPVDGWPTGPQSPADLPQAAADRIKLERANRADDGAYSLLVLRRLSKPLTALAARRGWSPNAITIASFIIGLAAAVLFSTGQRWALVLGAILLQISLVVDCSDGEVARLTGQYSTIGAWLDASTDRVKEYAAFAGLAIGAAVNGQNVWLWACVALILQTTRHLGDYTFNRVQVRIETTTALAALRNPGANGPKYGPILAPGASSDRVWVEKVKKIIHLPIGERWLLISLTAAFLTPIWTFVVLIVLGLLALAYTTLGRYLRCRNWPATPTGADLVVPQLDLGPLASLSKALIKAARARAAGRFGWALPSVSALVELSLWTLVAVIMIPDWLPAAYVAIFVIAFHRYDILYRTLAGKSFPTLLHAVLGGVDGRILYLLVILVASLFSPLLLAAGYVAADVWLGILGVGIASVQWVRSNTHQS